MAKVVNEAGEVWAIPIADFGFCAAVVARRAEPSDPVGFSLVYVLMRTFAELPDRIDIPELADWGEAWVGLVGRRPFSTGRWTRVGELPEFRAVEWPMPPWSEGPAEFSSDRDIDQRSLGGWSIATTSEIPSMTLLANDPVSGDEAAQFPPWQIITAPSSLEKALRKHFKGADPTFWEIDVATMAVDADIIERWREFGDEARSRSPDPPSWLPASRRTDRSLSGGEWLTFPAAGGGFGVALFIARPPVFLRAMADGLVLVFERVWSEWPTPDEAKRVGPEDVACLAQTSMICVRDGRWRVLDNSEPLDTDRWPLPTWWRVSDRSDRHVEIAVEDGVLLADVGSDAIAADPDAGAAWTGSSLGYGSLEHFASGVYVTTYMRESFGVTQRRLAAWRGMNERIEKALGRPLADLWAGEISPDGGSVR